MDAMQQPRTWSMLKAQTSVVTTVYVLSRRTRCAAGIGASARAEERRLPACRESRAKREMKMGKLGKAVIFPRRWVSPSQRHLPVVVSGLRGILAVDSPGIHSNTGRWVTWNCMELKLSRRYGIAEKKKTK
jgi:hypothetical protein